MGEPDRIQDPELQAKLNNPSIPEEQSTTGEGTSGAQTLANETLDEPTLAEGSNPLESSKNEESSGLEEYDEYIMEESMEKIGNPNSLSQTMLTGQDYSLEGERVSLNIEVNQKHSFKIGEHIKTMEKEMKAVGEKGGFLVAGSPSGEGEDEADVEDGEEEEAGDQSGSGQGLQEDQEDDKAAEAVDLVVDVEDKEEVTDPQDLGNEDNDGGSDQSEPGMTTMINRIDDEGNRTTQTLKAENHEDADTNQLIAAPDNNEDRESHENGQPHLENDCNQSNRPKHKKSLKSLLCEEDTIHGECNIESVSTSISNHTFLTEEFHQRQFLSKGRPRRKRSRSGILQESISETIRLTHEEYEKNNLGDEIFNTNSLCEENLIELLNLQNPNPTAERSELTYSEVFDDLQPSFDYFRFTKAISKSSTNKKRG